MLVLINISFLKNNQVTNTHLMTFIHQNKFYHVTSVQNWHSTRAKLPRRSKPRHLHATMPTILGTHEIKPFFNCSQHEVGRK